MCCVLMGLAWPSSLPSPHNETRSVFDEDYWKEDLWTCDIYLKMGDGISALISH